MFRSTGKKGNYAYTSARVKAKKSKLLREEDYNKMLMMSVPEISHYISDAGYSREMADLATRHSGLDLLEYATYANMAKAFRSILLASTGELYDMVLAYLTKWDFWNLKVVLRGKSYGLAADQIREDLVPAGKLQEDSLNKLLAAGTIEDTLAVFSAMAHVHFPTEILNSYKDTHSLGDIEDYLVKVYYKNLLELFGTDTRPSLIFRNYIRSEIDVLNLETVLKLKAGGILGEAGMKYYVPGGIEIDEKLMLQMLTAPDMKTLEGSVAQIQIAADIKGVLPTNPTMQEIVAAMKQYEIGLANSVAHMYPLSVIPVFDYMIHKENEVGNIRMIARGTESGLDRETMKTLLVM